MNKHILIPFSKYQRLIQNSGQSQPQTQTQPDIEMIEHDKDVDVDSIVSILPKRCQSKGRALLNILQHHLTWNARGELVVNGQIIPTSHIADLVKYTVVRHFGKQKPPIGYSEYCTIIEDLNIPKSLIVNSGPCPKDNTQWIGF